MSFGEIIKSNFKRTTLTRKGLFITAVFGLTYGTWSYLAFRSWHAFAFSLLFSYCFGFISPITWQVRLPFLENFSKRVRIISRAAFSLLFDYVFIVLLFSTYFYVIGILNKMLSLGLFKFVGIYTVIFATIGLFISQGYEAEQELKKGKAREKELEDLAARSQLAALRAQINPHFLFNALNSIAELIKTDPDRAEESLMLLAEVFRHSLNIADKQFIALSEEIHFIRAYLEIEKIRFGDRLQVKIQVDPQLGDLQVPCLIIQPLAENAIKHGISGRADGGHIDIEVVDNGPSAIISVSDSGNGIPENQMKKIFETGRIGLYNVKERLVKIYGEDYLPEIESKEGMGTKISIYIPKKI